MVDTSFAAEAAARMLAARAKMGNAQQAPQAAAQRESGAFKQMKESLNKPAAGGISSAMGNTFGPNKSNLPTPDKGHVVRDQTTSNINRVNVKPKFTLEVIRSSNELANGKPIEPDLSHTGLDVTVHSTNTHPARPA